MRTRVRPKALRNVMGLIVTLAITSSFANAQAAGIDPALLAKANGGDAAAQVQVGEACAEGKGVVRDPVKAVQWYRMAADKGDVSAELHLAVLYRDGAGKTFPRDSEQSAAWYLKAAEQGDVSAQVQMATLFSMGMGVARSDVDAYFWLDLAASVPGPSQSQYMANRQIIGMRITADDLEAIHDREDKWKAAHPRPASAH